MGNVLGQIKIYLVTFRNDTITDAWVLLLVSASLSGQSLFQFPVFISAVKVLTGVLQEMSPVPC